MTRKHYDYRQTNRKFVERKMAAGNHVMHQRPDKETSRDEDNKDFSILGKSMGHQHVPAIEVSSCQDDMLSPATSSRPSTSNTYEDHGEPFGAMRLPPDALNLLQSVITMNKNLEHQIDALRLRIDVEEKNHQTERQKIIEQKEKELKQKEKEIDGLRESVFNREERIEVLLQEKEDQELEITKKIDEIEELRDLVSQTEGHADKLSKKVSKLREEKRLLETDVVYKQQNEEIRKLRHELAQVKDRLNSMETELLRARNVIDQQNKKIKSLEIERSEIDNKFKQELEKASKAMRQEVERMREVMKQQYEEMKNLREQNREISNDVRDIKELLMAKASEPPTYRSQPMSISAISGNNRSNTPHVRASMPTMRPGYSQNPSRGLPPISSRDKDNKWVPSGTSKRSMNALSAKGKKT